MGSQQQNKLDKVNFGGVMSFESDLQNGKVFEHRAAKLICDKFGGNVFVTQGKYGADIFFNNNGVTEAVEVKFQREHWVSGNVAYEFANLNSFQPSGLMSTRCQWWVDVIKSGEQPQFEAYYNFYMIRIAQLRAMVTSKLKTGGAFIVNGGDNRMAVMAVVDFECIQSNFDLIGCVTENDILSNK